MSPRDQLTAVVNMKGLVAGFYFLFGRSDWLHEQYIRGDLLKGQSDWPFISYFFYFITATSRMSNIHENTAGRSRFNSNQFY